MSKLTFESITCSRCGGSGRHSYCQQYADMCFKCSGRGEVLTKRGQAAQNFYFNSRKKPMRDFAVGDIFVDDYNGKAYRVKEPSIPDRLNEGNWILSCDGLSYHTTPDRLLMFGVTKAQRIELIRAALEYQAKLTKSGQLMKKFQ